jgi:cytochrome c5
MIPYYPTSDYAHREALSNRDKWGNPDSKDLLDWFTKGFAPVYDRRCAACHGETKEWSPNDPNKKIFTIPRQSTWIDLTNPEWSPALTAHLAKAANGRGIPAKGFEFASTADPDYQALLAAMVEGSRQAYATPEADMPGFVSRSQDRAFAYEPKTTELPKRSLHLLEAKK